MSWFLIARGNKRSNARKQASTPPGTWDPMRTLAAVKLLLILAAAIGAGYGWRYGRDALRDYARRHAPQAVQPDGVILADAPPWMSQPLSLRLRGLVAAELYGRPLDGDALARAVGALRESPWVESVDRVERRSLGSVVVTARYRRPVALVEAPDGCHLVDAFAVRLPGIYAADQQTQLRLPLIVGQQAPPPPIGNAWPGDDLRAALALTRHLSQTPILQSVTAVDVGHRDQRHRIRLILWTGPGRDLARSPHVIWGLPPGAEQPYEPDADTKLSRLAVVIRRASAREKIVDISGAAVWQHEPIGGDVIRSAEYTRAW